MSLHQKISALFVAVIMIVCSCNEPHGNGPGSLSKQAIDANVNNRMTYLVSLYGSEQKLATAAGEPIAQLREQVRKEMISTMIAEKVVNKNN